MRATRQIALPVGILFVALLAACGGGGGLPVSKPPAPTLMSIAVSPGTMSVAKGLTQQLKATGTYSDGSTADVTGQSTWASTVTPVATINAAGLAQSVAPGTSSITATDGTVSGSASLTVTAAVPQSIAITPAKSGMSVGTNQQLAATLTYSDGTSVDGTSQANWTSGDTTVATVGAASGLVTGVAAGSAQITATIGNISSTAASVYVVTSTWTATASLSAGRAEHTATLLANGKVFIAGGDAAVTGGPIVERAAGTWEIYDPGAGTWSTGNLVVPRSRHSATLLSDGRVLIVGGDDGYQDEINPWASTEIFDPSTGTSVAAGNLLTARALHTVTLLPNGEVLVAGGQTTSTGPNFPSPTATAELYDPASGASVATNNELNFHLASTAILLANGKVLVADGMPELYDPTTQIWSPTGKLAGSFQNPPSGATATLLNDGRVLLAGGNATLSPGGTAVSNLAELYSPTSNTWTAAGSLNIGRSGHTATLLANGKVLVTGGVDHSNKVMSSAEVYDPATDTWSLTASLPVAAIGHTATLLANGQVLVVGGETGPGLGDIPNAELYTP